jgi:hypothetical protein
MVVQPRVDFHILSVNLHLVRDQVPRTPLGLRESAQATPPVAVAATWSDGRSTRRS